MLVLCFCAQRFPSKTSSFGAGFVEDAILSGQQVRKVESAPECPECDLSDNQCELPQHYYMRQSPLFQPHLGPTVLPFQYAMVCLVPVRY